MESLRTLALAWIAVGMGGLVAQADYLPENDLHLEDHLYFNQSVVTEADFNRVIDEVAAIYGPLATQWGGKLETRKNWADPKVNARATQMMGSWIIDFTGGLARRPEITADGFQLIVCHEVGHHFAGFSFAGTPLDQLPFPIPGLPSGGAQQWAANEGQSDYFASQVCARKLWAKEIAKNAEYRKTVPPAAQALCDQAWKSVPEQDLCYRIADGGAALGRVMAAIGKDKTIPEFDKPDTTVVKKTADGHPKPQCRLDTTMAGAMCSATYLDNLIPGKKTKEGGSSIEAERESSQVTCMAASGHAIGLRPQCWFKSRL